MKLHFFKNFTLEEVAGQLGASLATVEKELRAAKAWLHRRLGPWESRLTQETWKKVTALFTAALGRAANERRDFLDQACAGDVPRLRDEVLDLLDHHGQAEQDGFSALLKAPYASKRAGFASSPVPDEDIGTKASPRYVKFSLGRSISPHPPITLETLLRERMPIVPLIVLSAFVIFFLFDLYMGFDQGLALGFGEGNIGRLIFWMHVFVMLTALTAVVAWYTWSPWTERALNTVAYTLMAVTAAFFVLYTLREFSAASWQAVARPGREAEVLDMTADACGLRWFAFLVFYGLFMPTTWGKCLRTLGFSALVRSQRPRRLDSGRVQFGECGALFELAAWLVTGMAMAVYGSYKITEWRHEAMTARKLGVQPDETAGRRGVWVRFISRSTLSCRVCAPSSYSGLRRQATRRLSFVLSARRAKPPIYRTQTPSESSTMVSRMTAFSISSSNTCAV